MASFLYDEFVTSLMGAPSASGFRPDFEDSDLRLFFVDHASDVPSQAADQTVDDRAVGARYPNTFADSPLILNQTVLIDANVGKFDGDDTVFALFTAPQCESIDLFQYVSDTATQDLLIANFNDYTGLPITPSGGNLAVIWPATGIIRI